MMETGPQSSITLVVHGPDVAPSLFADMCRLFAEEYAKSDDWDNDWDMSLFINAWPKRRAAPGFVMISAFVEDEIVGFAFGYSLSPQTRWWNGGLDKFPQAVVEEWPGRTFAINEIIVKREFRQQGIAKRLHAHLIAEVAEERVTLLVRVENDVAYNAYVKWGYSPAGRIQPLSDAPIFNAMIKHLQQP